MDDKCAPQERYREEMAASKFPQLKRDRIPGRAWRFVVIALLVIGICFRFAHLDQKIYWFDEVATSIRVAGYTKTDVEQQFAHQGVVRAQDLLAYKTLQPATPFRETWSALKQSPEQAPLYYLLAYQWVRLFGSSVTAIRSLSVLFSFLALPCLYWLGLELFKAPQPAWILVMLLSVSPFFVAYAQEARPYSLWAVTILLSSVAYLRSQRSNTCSSWLFYMLSLAMGFYTSLLSFFVALGHGLHLLLLGKVRSQATLYSFLAAVGGAIALFIPWLLVILNSLHNFEDNTVWMRAPMSIAPRIAIGIAPILLTFGDLPFPTPPDLTISEGLGILIAIFVLALIIYAVRFISTCTNRWISAFVLTLGLTTPLSLVLLDIVQQGQTSANPRYMIPLQTALQLAVAYLFASRIFVPAVKLQLLWQGLLAGVIGLGLFSCTLNLDQSPIYQKSRNLHNLPIADILNAAESPILLAEPQEALDLISLSHSLEPDIQVVPFTGDVSRLAHQSRPLFLFNPSVRLQTQLQANPALEVVPVYEPTRLISAQITLSLWAVHSGQAEP